MLAHMLARQVRKRSARVTGPEDCSRQVALDPAIPGESRAIRTEPRRPWPPFDDGTSAFPTPVVESPDRTTGVWPPLFPFPGQCRIMPTTVTRR
jgi:hypothetical protein